MRHDLVGVAENRNELASHVAFAAVDERVRPTLLTGATGTADAVHVIFDLVREVVVNDQVAILDVQTARGDVSGDEDRRAALTELVQDPVAFSLFLVAVNDASQVTDGATNLIAHAFRGAEDERLERITAFRRAVQDFHQALLLVEAAEDFNVLRNVLVSHELIGFADVHLDRVSQDGRRDANHSLGPRRGEEERLTIHRNVLKNLTNLRLETHIQHAISLVEDDIRRRRHVDHAALQ